MKNLSENDLVKKLSEGDKVSFGILFNVYYKRLSSIALYYLNDEESAKDVIQDVFAIVWERHDGLKEVHNLSSWLFSMTKNQCLKKIDHLKVKQKHTDYLKYRELEITQSALSDLDTSPLTFDEINTIIQKTLKSLSPQARRIFEMSRFGHKKNREISEELGISIKTVEANMSKSLKVFKRSLRHYLPFVLFLLQ
ncbi:RNA polymerase sigma-70 factor [Saccharicrinis sp. GN24d3]|uniref:RNA polymerase sigma-70 factor n=1 Tax=Saccharicrinis sp. GN24d3 TaxID=3458416 RepID=UPI0040361949